MVGTPSRPDRKSTSPSGVQPWTTSSAGCHVSRSGCPPVAGMTYTSVLPPYWPEKATHRPSALNAGSVSAPSELVSRVASPPSRATSQRSLACTKTMCDPLTSGCRRKRVPWASATAGGVKVAAPKSVARASSRPVGIVS